MRHTHALTLQYIFLALYKISFWDSMKTQNKMTTEFIGLAYQGKDIVFRFIIEYSSSFRDFGT
jgi:hypothetical protein